MHRVRLAVRENRLTTLAIREEHYIPAIEATGRGWVIDKHGVVVAFAIGNSDTGNIWALFVHPDHEGQGHGRALQHVMVGWLFEQGLTRLYLTTEPGTRAQRFYENTGWFFVEIDSKGEAVYERYSTDASRLRGRQQHPRRRS